MRFFFGRGQPLGGAIEFRFRDLRAPKIPVRIFDPALKEELRKEVGGAKQSHLE